MAARPHTDGLAPRVSVLEASVDSLKADVGSLRAESREGFASLRGALDKAFEKISHHEAHRPRHTNWYAVGGFVAGAIAIIGSIFSLAEWRVSTAFGPVVERVQELREEVKDARRHRLELTIQLERERILREALQIKKEQRP